MSTSCPVSPTVLTFIPKTSTVSHTLSQTMETQEPKIRALLPERVQASGEDRAKDLNNSSWWKSVSGREAPGRGLTSELNFEG